MKKSGQDEKEERGREKKEWQCLVFAPVLGLVSFSRRASGTIYLVKKQLRERERNTRLSALFRDGCSGETAARRDHG